jgi:predicted HicB family RNase H-like nuclease
LSKGFCICNNKKEIVIIGTLVARPKKPENEKANDVIPPIRVTKEQKEAYKKAAKDNGFSLSAWIKKILDKEVKG